MTEEEQAELESRLGFFGAGCPCAGHEKLRQEALREIREQ